VCTAPPPLRRFVLYKDYSLANRASPLEVHSPPPVVKRKVKEFEAQQRRLAAEEVAKAGAAEEKATAKFLARERGVTAQIGDHFEAAAVEKSQVSSKPNAILSLLLVSVSPHHCDNYTVTLAANIGSFGSVYHFLVSGATRGMHVVSSMWVMRTTSLPCGGCF
jgi:hypothetical protein